MNHGVTAAPAAAEPGAAQQAGDTARKVLGLQPSKDTQFTTPPEALIRRAIQSESIRKRNQQQQELSGGHEEMGMRGGLGLIQPREQRVRDMMDKALGVDSALFFCDEVSEKLIRDNLAVATVRRLEGHPERLRMTSGTVMNFVTDQGVPIKTLHCDSCVSLDVYFGSKKFTPPPDQPDHPHKDSFVINKDDWAMVVGGLPVPMSSQEAVARACGYDSVRAFILSLRMNRPHTRRDCYEGMLFFFKDPSGRTAKFFDPFSDQNGGRDDYRPGGPL